MTLYTPTASYDVDILNTHRLAISINHLSLSLSSSLSIFLFYPSYHTKTEKKNLHETFIEARRTVDLAHLGNKESPHIYPFEIPASIDTITAKALHLCLASALNCTQLVTGQRTRKSRRCGGRGISLSRGNGLSG